MKAFRMLKQMAATAGLLTMIATPATVMAQETSQSNPQSQDQSATTQHGHRHEDELTKLNLTDDQKAQVKAIHENMKTQMDALATKNLLLAGTRVDLLQNELVLIAPKDSKVVTSFNDLKRADVRVIAAGDPRSVPAGAYGQQVLSALGLYDTVKGKMTLGTDVRQVLAAVETGSAEAGLVYATDAAISSKVRVVMDAPAGTHQSIVYPAAVLRVSMNANAARAYVNYLASSAARDVFARYGFRPAAK